MAAASARRLVEPDRGFHSAAREKTAERVEIMLGFLKQIGRRSLDVLFPWNCVYCQGELVGGEGFLCPLCRNDLDWIVPPYCFRCGAPAEISYDYPTENFECGRCRDAPFAFDRARSLGRYDTVLKALIHFFKYRKQPGAVQEFRGFMENFFKNRKADYEDHIVAPVPLHRRKVRQRGFDQSFLIAREAARILDLPLDATLLERVRETDTQTRKTRRERAANIRGAFQVVQPEKIEGRKVLLVDDVFTTGATLNEVARTVKKCGGGQVAAFTLGRVP